MKSIVPIGEVERRLVEDYLCANTAYFRRHGRAAVAWKYFDPAFNRGRNRGFVWVRGGEVGGFIGVVPAALAHAGQVVPIQWTCDWGLRDPNGTPGMGIKLLHHVLRHHPQVATIGGNALTRSLVPRIAAKTIEAGAHHAWWPLRSGALLHLAADRAPALRPLATSLLGRLPLPRLARPTRARAVVVDGVAARLEPLLAEDAPAAWTVRYDVPDLEWAVARCPGLVAASCYVDGAGGPLAGAVLWYAAAETMRHVRFALWARPGAADAARAVIDGVVGAARARGAAMISTLVGSADRAVADAVRAAGLYRRRGALPLYVMAPGVDTLGGVNYLASDLAQRFRATGDREP